MQKYVWHKSYTVHHRICAIHNWLGVCAGIPIIIDTVYIEDSRKSRHYLLPIIGKQKNSIYILCYKVMSFDNDLHY